MERFCFRTSNLDKVKRTREAYGLPTEEEEESVRHARLAASKRWVHGPNVTRDQIEEISAYPSVKRWMKGKEPKSRKEFARYMVRFNRAIGKTPEQFLEWSEKQKSVEVQDLIDEVAETIEAPAAKFSFSNAIRSFLRANGYNNLPRRSHSSYTLKEWHKGYTKPEIRQLLSFLDNRLQKLYVYVSAETGLRANTVLSIRYRHIKEDLEAGVMPVAIRLEPSFYGKSKSAGFTFLGRRSVQLLKEAIKDGLIKTEPESLIFPFKYTPIYKQLHKARKLANLDPKIQPNHGLRKYFENSLDMAHIDPDKKHMIEGHFETTRDKNYTGREWDELRPLYQSAYPHIDIDAGDPELEGKIQSWTEEKQQLEDKVKTLEDQLKEKDTSVLALANELHDVIGRLEKLEKQKAKK